MPASEATRPIVIGDAEPEARAHLAAALRQDGYEVLEAENGLEALLYVKRVRPAAVIVTLDLPASPASKCCGESGCSIRASGW